jgi:hypothetical protein
MWLKAVLSPCSLLSSAPPTFDNNAADIGRRWCRNVAAVIRFSNYDGCCARIDEDDNLVHLWEQSARWLVQMVHQCCCLLCRQLPRTATAIRRWKYGIFDCAHDILTAFSLQNSVEQQLAFWAKVIVQKDEGEKYEVQMNWAFDDDSPKTDESFWTAASIYSPDEITVCWNNSRPQYQQFSPIAWHLSRNPSNSLWELTNFKNCM